MNTIEEYIEIAATVIEVTGVLTIMTGTAIALFKFVSAKQGITPRSYKLLRQQLGKAILLGLEILVAGDIIATVVTEPTLDKVIILAIIVLIRTFLSISIEVEIEGRFPWEKKNQ